MSKDIISEIDELGRSMISTWELAKLQRAEGLAQLIDSHVEALKKIRDLLESDDESTMMSVIQWDGEFKISGLKPPFSATIDPHLDKMIEECGYSWSLFDTVLHIFDGKEMVCYANEGEYIIRIGNNIAVTERVRSRDSVESNE